VGGGLVAAPELKEVRMKADKMKAEQIKKVGAKVVVTACENCVLQLKDLNERYGLGVEIRSLLDLTAQALEVNRDSA